MTEVILYSKPGCHLCEVVKSQLARLREKAPFVLREVNILEHAEAHEKYKDEIPVIFINGRKSFKFRLDEAEFLQRLARIREEVGDRHAS